VAGATLNLEVSQVHTQVFQRGNGGQGDGSTCKCVGAVDGGMVALEDGTTRTDVQRRELDWSGGSVMRTAVQLFVQDRVSSYEMAGENSQISRNVRVFFDRGDWGQPLSGALMYCGYTSRGSFPAERARPE
jgi:hypothetical protein